MIDFRYHLVSLVAVFMALAVGILLGAGPLREELGATLEGQVNELREERAVLRTELDQSQRVAANREDLIDALGPAALDRRLSGVRVGVIVAPGADESMREGLEETISAAGGDVVVTVELDERTEQADAADLREEVVDQLAPTLDLPDPREGGEPTLGGVIAATLGGSDPEGQVGQWRAAQAVLEENELLTVEWVGDDDEAEPVADRRPPDAFIVLTGELAAEDSEWVVALRLDLVAGLGVLEVPTVVVSRAADEWIDDETRFQDDVIAGIRADSAVREQVSTVDNAGLASGQVVTVLALGWELTGVSGHFGFGPDADAVTPAVPAIRLVEDVWQDGLLQPGEPSEPGAGDTGDTGEEEQQLVPGQEVPGSQEQTDGGWLPTVPTEPTEPDPSDPSDPSDPNDPNDVAPTTQAPQDTDPATTAPSGP